MSNNVLTITEGEMSNYQENLKNLFLEGSSNGRNWTALNTNVRAKGEASGQSKRGGAEQIWPLPSPFNAVNVFDWEQFGRDEYSNWKAVDCSNMFTNWTETQWNPLYNTINSKNMNKMFYRARIPYLGIRLKELRTVDCEDFSSAFEESEVKSLGHYEGVAKPEPNERKDHFNVNFNIDFVCDKVENFDRVFKNCQKLVTIGTIQSHSGLTFEETFQGCFELREVRFDGIIDYDGLDFRDCPRLSSDSIYSLLTHLSQPRVESSKKTLYLNENVITELKKLIFVNVAQIDGVDYFFPPSTELYNGLYEVWNYWNIISCKQNFVSFSDDSANPYYAKLVSHYDYGYNYWATDYADQVALQDFIDNHVRLAAEYEGRQYFMANYGEGSGYIKDGENIIETDIIEEGGPFVSQLITDDDQLNQCFHPLRKTIKPTYAFRILSHSNESHGLRRHALKDLTDKVDLDFSETRSANEAFRGLRINKIGDINLLQSYMEYNNRIFQECTELVAIGEITVPLFSCYHDVFDGCYELTTLSFTPYSSENNIGIGHPIDLSDCFHLSHDSIVSIVNALSPTVRGKAVTLWSSAVYDAFGGNLEEGSEWDQLINTKSNWSFSLI